MRTPVLPEGWVVADEGRYITSSAGTCHVAQETLVAAIMTEGALDYGGGIENGSFIALCGLELHAFPFDIPSSPFCKSCLGRLGDVERSGLKQRLVADLRKAQTAQPQSSIEFRRSSSGRRRHICDWTGQVICALDTKLHDRPETNLDDPRDEWCWICTDVIDECNLWNDRRVFDAGPRRRPSTVRLMWLARNNPEDFGQWLENLRELAKR